MDGSALSRSAVARAAIVTLRNLCDDRIAYRGDVFNVLNIGLRPCDRHVRFERTSQRASNKTAINAISDTT